MSRVAFIFPGQGAQYVGMGRDFYARFKAAKETFEEADALLGSAFSSLIFEGPLEELTLTKNSQLALYITSVALWRVVCQELPRLQPAVCSGLSLGEYSALTAAGVLPFSEGVSLVRARGLFMHEASITHPGSMRVVLSLAPEEVEQVLAGIEGVSIANLNCPGQVVIAGEEEALRRAEECLRERGARRVLPLDVSGAFHSPLMASAQERLAPLIARAKLVPSKIRLVCNVTGGYVGTLDEVRSCLIEQVTRPVLWDLGIRTIEREGIDAYYEIGPGKTLTGMNKRIGVSAPTFSVERVADLEEIAHAAVEG